MRVLRGSSVHSVLRSWLTLPSIPVVLLKLTVIAVLSALYLPLQSQQKQSRFDKMLILPLLLLVIPRWTLFHTLGCPSTASMSVSSYIFDHTLFAFVSVLIVPCLFCCISFLSFSCKLCRIDLQSNQNRNAVRYFTWKQVVPNAIPACFPRAI